MKIRLALATMAALLVLAAVLRRRGGEEARAVPAVNPIPTVEHADGNSPSGSFAPPSLSAVLESENGDDPLERPIPLYWWDHAMIRLARLQNPDGSWGGNGIESFGDRRLDEVGMTGLVLSAFSSQGTSHLSKDVHDGICLGTVVKAGLKWLLARQSEDGTFATAGDADLNQLLATLALTEAYGATATSLIKDPAQRAVDAFQRSFQGRTDWGDSTMAAWAALAVASARDAELELDDAFVYRNEYALSGATPGESDRATAAWGLLQNGRHQPALESAALRRLDEPPELLDLERAYFETILTLKGLPPRNDEVKHRWRQSLQPLLERGRSICTDELGMTLAEIGWTEPLVVDYSFCLLIQGAGFRFGD